MHARYFPVAAVMVALWAEPVFSDLNLRQIPGQAEVGTVEIHHVAADAFKPELWRAGTLNFIADARSPLIAPRLDGVFRNIYAPSAVQVPGGWRLFYGAWDGVPTGNDRIYSVTTPDFLTFANRQIVVEHGAFVHVCNVSGIGEPSGDALLMCTAYPVGPNLNKPAAFRVPLGDVTGNPVPLAACPPVAQSAPSKTAEAAPRGPIPASNEHLVAIEGYDRFAAADMNGMNALLLEDGRYRLYFGDFKNPGQVHRATSTDGTHFQYDGPSLTAHLMVNDVKKFAVAGRPCYLMGLHANRDRLWYALSDDGMRFEPQKEFAASAGPADRYIVAIGWVTQADRLLGFVYGAGASPELNRNRLFARWLQKKLVFTAADGRQLPATAAFGPNRAILSLGQASTLSGTIQVFAEDGKTPLSQPMPIKLQSGAVYELTKE